MVNILAIVFILSSINHDRLVTISHRRWLSKNKSLQRQRIDRMIQVLYMQTLSPYSQIILFTLHFKLTKTLITQKTFNDLGGLTM